MTPGSLAAMYNLQSTPPPAGASSGLAGLSKPAPDDAMVSQFWHPHSPLFWAFAIAGVTVGLIGASLSGSTRLGPLHASGSVGAGKS